MQRAELLNIDLLNNFPDFINIFYIHIKGHPWIKNSPTQHYKNVSNL